MPVLSRFLGIIIFMNWGDRPLPHFHARYGDFEITVEIQKLGAGSQNNTDMIQIIVEDNGRGLDGSTTNSGRFLAARPSVDGLGIGLTNTRSRLKVLFGERYLFRMNNTASGGCRVEIRLPLDELSVSVVD